VPVLQEQKGHRGVTASADRDGGVLVSFDWDSYREIVFADVR
jgi:hypothetical protein